MFLEETSYGRIPISATAVTMIVAGAVERFGTEEQKTEYLGRIAAGAPLAIAMSEPGSGSDVASMRTKAVVEGDTIVVNGHKTWITCAREAEEILLIARSTQGDRKHEGLSMVFIPTDTPGIEIRPIMTMGGDEQCDVFFTDVTVPASNVLGQVGNGWMQLVAGLNVERLIIGAVMLGIARRAFDDTLAYIREREQFGKKIGSFQSMKHKVADLSTELRCAELLVYDIARKIAADPHQLLPREASMAKLKVSRGGQEDRARGRADDGWLRLRHRVRHGVLPAPDDRRDDLRRHERDPEGHHRRHLRPLGGSGATGRRIRGVATRPATHRARGLARREALLRAAVEIVAERGVGGATHRAIAERAQVPPSTTTTSSPRSTS